LHKREEDMKYTITTDEPLQKWCRPAEEGITIDVVEQSKLKHTPGFTEPHVRRYASMRSSTGELVWMEIPAY
jgi:hypothetical protein